MVLEMDSVGVRAPSDDAAARRHHRNLCPKAPRLLAAMAVRRWAGGASARRLVGVLEAGVVFADERSLLAQRSALAQLGPHLVCCSAQSVRKQRRSRKKGDAPKTLPQSAHKICILHYLAFFCLVSLQHDVPGLQPRDASAHEHVLKQHLCVQGVSNDQVPSPRISKHVWPTV